MLKIFIILYKENELAHSTVKELFPLCHTEKKHIVHRDMERKCAQNKGLYFAFHQIKILGVRVIKKREKAEENRNDL